MNRKAASRIIVKITTDNYRYGHINRLMFDYTASDDYNTSFTYDKRGNFMSLTRKQDGVMIDDLAYNYITGNANQIKTITDGADYSKGYKSSSTSD